MISLIRGTALMAMLTVAAPVWAQVPVSAEYLNRAELHRLATTTIVAYPVAVAPAFVPDPVGLIAAEGPRPAPVRFPGLLPMLGVGVVAAGSALNTVVAGVPTQY